MADALMNVDDALGQLLKAARVLPEATPRPLGKALGNILAETPVAAVTVPPADNSAVDGYALNSRDASQPSLPVSQRIAAGQDPLPLEPGTAARIFTGAAVPDGADTVMMQENASLEGKRSSFRAPRKPTRTSGPPDRISRLAKRSLRLVRVWNPGTLDSLPPLGCRRCGSTAPCASPF